MVLNDFGWANGVSTSSTFDSIKLQERPGIQSQAAAAIVTMDKDMDSSLRPISAQAHTQQY